MSEEIIGDCWNCGQGLTKLDYGRETTCTACRKDTRCCRNCRHYAPGRPNECIETMVERVMDKTKANFCELFEPSSHQGQEGADTGNPEALRHAAEDLFKF